MEDKIKELIKLVKQLEKLVISLVSPLRIDSNTNQNTYIEGWGATPAF